MAMMFRYATVVVTAKLGMVYLGNTTTAKIQKGEAAPTPTMVDFVNVTEGKSRGRKA